MISTTAVFAYLGFRFFSFYQQLHGKHFKGDSEVFRTLLNVFAFSAMVVGLSFYAFCFMYFEWWVAPMLFAASMSIGFVGPLIERKISPLSISMAGFVVWPACAVIMFMLA